MYSNVMLKIKLCISGINYILKYIQIEKSFWIVILFHNITDFEYFYQINAVFLSVRDVFQKHFKKF